MFIFRYIYIIKKKERKIFLSKNIFSPSRSLVVNLHLHPSHPTHHHLVSVNTSLYPPVSQLGINRNEEKGDGK
jgi:hypothetical protein